jgi:hypothetical protein
MCKDCLSFVVDFFNDKRASIFQRRETIPGHVGLVWSARPYGNVGSMRSYGTDGNISFSQEINKDWSFTVRGNYTNCAKGIRTMRFLFPTVIFSHGRLLQMTPKVSSNQMPLSVAS